MLVGHQVTRCLGACPRPCGPETVKVGLVLDRRVARGFHQADVIDVDARAANVGGHQTGWWQMPSERRRRFGPALVLGQGCRAQFDRWHGRTARMKFAA